MARLKQILPILSIVVLLGCGDLMVQSVPEEDPAEVGKGLVITVARSAAGEVARVEYIIAAVDMDTLRGELTAGHGDVIRGLVNGVKAGPDRVVTLSAYDAEGIRTYTASDTTDVVEGQTVHVIIALRSLPAGEESGGSSGGEQGSAASDSLARVRAELLLGFWRFDFILADEAFSVQYHLQVIGEVTDNGEYLVRGVSERGDDVAAVFDPEIGRYRLLHFTDIIAISAIFFLQGESASGEVRIAFWSSEKGEFSEEEMYPLQPFSGRMSGFSESN